MVRVISGGFPAAAAAVHEADASACVKLELLMVSVISWPLLFPDKSPAPPMTWLRSCEPAESTWKHRSVTDLMDRQTHLSYEPHTHLWHPAQREQPWWPELGWWLRTAGPGWSEGGWPRWWTRRGQRWRRADRRSGRRGRRQRWGAERGGRPAVTSAGGGRGRSGGKTRTSAALRNISRTYWFRDEGLRMSREAHKPAVSKCILITWAEWK